MRGVYTVDQIRAAEAPLLESLPDGALMARAATGLAVECASLLGTVYGARVVLLVGAGNNGGDALYAGAWLARRGADVRAVLVDPDRAHVDGLAALRRCGGRVAPSAAASVAGASLVVDGLLGIGGRGGLRGSAASLAQALGACPVVAADIPSGVDADTGVVEGVAVRADVTVAFGALKAGLVVGDGRVHAGEIRLVEIGLSLPAPSACVLEAADVAALLPVPTATDDKYTRGVVGVVAGSVDYPGAGMLATGSAVHGGAGMVRYAGTAASFIRARYPEVVVHEDSAPSELRVQAWTVGPGFGTDEAARSLLASALSADVPVLVDADGLTVLAGDDELRAVVRARTQPTLLTPHDREFERLTGSVPGSDRLSAARAAASDLDAILLLKGDATVVATPDGQAWINPTGTPWLGTAGSGDVLSGLIGSLLAAGLPAPLAAAAGAYVHGVAGQVAAADGPASSADVLAAVRPALRSLLAGR